MTRIIITGSKGRMGQTLIAGAALNPDLQVVGQIDVGDDLQTVIAFLRTQDFDLELKFGNFRS